MGEQHFFGEGNSQLWSTYVTKPKEWQLTRSQIEEVWGGVCERSMSVSIVPCFKWHINIFAGMFLGRDNI